MRDISPERKARPLKTRQSPALAQRAAVDARIASEGLVHAGRALGVAALLYTYQCTIACAHCCFGCAANRPPKRMSLAQGLAHLEALHELGRVIHIAGGECMMYWDDLLALLEAADSHGLAPHFIETNCSFADCDAVVEQRLSALHRHGVCGILFSTDPYHQAFVPPEHVLRVRRIGAEIFGRAGLWGTDAPDEAIYENERIARGQHDLTEYVRTHPPILVGTAYHRWRHVFENHSLAKLPLHGGWRGWPPARDCAREFQADTIWEIHIDPYDNIQTNCGIILANATEVRPRDLMAAGPEHANPLVELLVKNGPFALAEFAREHHGFDMPERAVSKCSFCYAVRCFLRPHYPGILGPDEVYGGPLTSRHSHGTRRRMPPASG